MDTLIKEMGLYHWTPGRPTRIASDIKELFQRISNLTLDTPLGDFGRGAGGLQLRHQHILLTGFPTCIGERQPEMSGRALASEELS